MLSKLKSWFRRQSHKGNLTLVAGVILMVTGISLVTLGVASQQSVPEPPESAMGTLTQSQQTNTPTLPYSRPVAITVSSIDVRSPLIEVGKNADGSIEVPAGPQVDAAAWYKYSPAPGQAGASVIIGHVDTYKSGPSVFFKLGKLKPGDIVKVVRADGITAVFQVNAVREYSKADFPSQAVYGSSKAAELRLITCGGSFDSSTDEYSGNIVVFATLAGSYGHLQVEEA